MSVERLFPIQQTVANLLSVYPASALYFGCYATVTDIYGDTTITPPVLRLNGAIPLGGFTFTPSTTNVWPGCRFELLTRGLTGNILSLSIGA